ncbi:potassium transporter [Cobetia marina]|jgi:monovalent cation:proton antiporter-2 (CPA2) family protein|uniref:monovalent cation:proton antiporter-2 (CPA2) family protein n=1 Tax=Cobetia TaxID=204286 RepID=UPI000984949F|nr:MULTISPECIES: monovalent cation:proton antiporter-2 (CPA2) family protein [Cobetia]MDA5562290.1 monovalent cation:proton antiporter-2 (CPA2) family protein [Cobetia sp. MMG027]MDH2290229.1 monovalent cation:proton antiporter-2 (CPA2) family protein [Cobetia sp. 10Alg 146]MDH2375063.1 monovalent cation:proton antiporter-2 (CPA2) family protein [Cobetia sp. 3AK]MDI6002234.1 monovalent cation:proton antiporter-2 (CPA2) family protein [Cobetia pacifica]MDN2655347.1 monovalent cation:proton anti
MNMLMEGAVLLGCAVVAVPLFQRLGLGSILGYLAIGVLLGPSLIGFISEPTEVLHFAEFGVVMLLFMIGLELEPKRLWDMRLKLAGLGSAQMLLCGALLTPVGLWLGLELPAAALLGLILALSSTAFALQVLSENQQLATPHGQSTFAILLFQDLAVIPLLALLPLFADNFDASTGSGWAGVAKGIGMVAAVIIVGRFVVPRLLKMVARSEIHEIFTAAALFVVISTALLMEWVGLSMALGAFLAGVLLADTVYRHELEANIDPFKGLLLGLFFMAVGMSVDVSLVMERPLTVLGLTLALMVGKVLVITLVGRVARLKLAEALPLAAVLAQGGEFDFVLLTAGMAAGIFDQTLTSLVISAVTLSMAATPFLYRYARKFGAAREAKRPYDEDFGQEAPPVLIAGFGRFGQMSARILKTQGINFTALDPNITQVEFVRQFGSRIFYADASRSELLRAAGAEHAQIMLVAVDDARMTTQIVRTVRQQFPHLKLFVRARNRHHAWELMELGVEHVIRETYASSLEMGNELLVAMGYPSARAAEVVRAFREMDDTMLKSDFENRHDPEALVTSAKSAMEELKRLFQTKG